MNTVDSITLTTSGSGYTNHITVPNGGHSGQVFTIGASSSTSWKDPAFSCNGNAMIKGKLIVNDKNIEDELDSIKTNLSKRLEIIEDRLAILVPNDDLESRWTELRQLRRQYKELEKECWEQEEIVRILKS
jgi:hypothetical protein